MAGCVYGIQEGSYLFVGINEIGSGRLVAAYLNAYGAEGEGAEHVFIGSVVAYGHNVVVLVVPHPDAGGLALVDNGILDLDDLIALQEVEAKVVRLLLKGG